MPIDPKLLEILRCPLTKQSLNVVTAQALTELNQKITSGEMQYADGTTVDETLNEGLITENGKRIYRIDAGIPIMLHAKSITLTSSEPSPADSV